MGMSTDGQICYGIIFEEGFEFPWDVEEYDNNIENWWRHVNNFKPAKEIYTDEGEKIEGITKEEVDQYWEEILKWDKENPVPVEVVNYCSYDFPMYILAIQGTVTTNSRGYPQELDFNKLTLSIEPQNYKKFIEFIRQWFPDLSEEERRPKWWLSSLIG